MCTLGTLSPGKNRRCREAQNAAGTASRATCGGLKGFGAGWKAPGTWKCRNLHGALLGNSEPRSRRGARVEQGFPGSRRGARVEQGFPGSRRGARVEQGFPGSRRGARVEQGFPGSRRGARVEQGFPGSRRGARVEQGFPGSRDQPRKALPCQDRRPRDCWGFVALAAPQVPVMLSEMDLDGY